MRNLKRALSLALASVMVLGLMIVGSNAKTADFTDAKDVDPEYATAIDVVTAIGVFEGMDDGTFAPTQTLRRAEAAKLMCVLLLGDKNAEKLDKSFSIFSDVLPNQWYTGYISHCAQTGILHGYGDGTFGPEDPLTGVQFGKLLLCALGYSSEIEGYANNPAWSIKVASSMISAGIDVDDVQLNDGITREQAAQMIFNTLKANMVYYRDHVDVNIGDVNVNVRGYAEVQTPTVAGISSANSYNIKRDGLVQFAEKYFPDLKKGTVQSGDFGRPTTQWDNKGTEIAKVTNDVDYILNGHVTYEVVCDTVSKEVSNYDVNGDNWYIYEDGNDETSSVNWNGYQARKDDDSTFAGTGNGSVTEFYIDPEDRSVTVCVINSYIAEVEEVKTSADVKPQEKPYIVLSDLSKTTPTSSDLEFETEEFKEGDIVIYTISDGKIITVNLAEKATGEVTRTSSQNFVLDGNTYYYSMNYSAVNSDAVDTTGSIYDIYLDEQGTVIYSKISDINLNYAYVIDASSHSDKYGTSHVSYGATLLLSDGTVVNADLKDNQTTLKHQVVKYSISKDNQYTLEQITGSVSETSVTSLKYNTGASDLDYGTGKVYANEKTIFLVCEDTTANNPSYSVYTGIKNAPKFNDTTGSKIVASDYVSGKDPAKIVFIGDASPENQISDVVFILLSSKSSKISEKDFASYYEYDAIINGKEGKVKINAANIDNGTIALTNIGGIAPVQKYTTDSDGIITGVTQYSASTPTSKEGYVYISNGATEHAKDGVIKLGGTQYAYSDNVIVAKITGTANKKISASTVESVTNDTNDNILVILNDKGIAVGIVVEKI